MSLTLGIGLILIGLMVGVVGGMVGIGGGVVVIPLLMFAFGMTQAKANGTSLAMMLPPIGVFAVLTYARAGNIDWRFAMLLALGFAAGALIGAIIVNTNSINPTALRVCFALFLVYCAMRMLFRPGGRARSALEVSIIVIFFALLYAVMRLIGKRLMHSPSRWGQMYRAKIRRRVEHDYEI